MIIECWAEFPVLYSRSLLVNHLKYTLLVAQMVKNLLAMQETSVQSLGWEDPLEEGLATLSSILAWRIPKDRGAWQAAVRGVSELDMTEWLSGSRRSIFKRDNTFSFLPPPVTAWGG